MLSILKAGFTRRFFGAGAVVLLIAVLMYVLILTGIVPTETLVPVARDNFIRLLVIGLGALFLCLTGTIFYLIAEGKAERVSIWKALSQHIFTRSTFSDTCFLVAVVYVLTAQDAYQKHEMVLNNVSVILAFIFGLIWIFTRSSDDKKKRDEGTTPTATTFEA